VPATSASGTRTICRASRRCVSPAEADEFEGRRWSTIPTASASAMSPELFDRDMGGKAIMAVPRPGHNKRND
jgi:hypothetical protein